MRERILEIAEGQMKAGGYGALNFAQIAQGLDTTRANLHYHFKTKERFACEVTKRFIADQEADLIKLAAQFSGDMPKYIAAMEDFLWSHHESNGQVGACVCAQIIRQPAVPDSLMALATKHFDNIRGILVEQVLTSIEKGTLRNDVDPMHVAIEAGCMMTGLSQMALFIPCEEHKLLKGTMKNWIKNYTP